MISLSIHPEASIEIKTAYHWYQRQVTGLGDDFLLELRTAHQAITIAPEACPKFSQNCRRFLLSKFPFSVIYENNENTVFIIAIMHNSRKPKYWSERH
ncbi:hypothetical protein SPONN_2688 [uncultured Candidatus Thioglobus sp.]|nr:hypothetical protein SPONN_2688 [uncultured Candidatus Thioglobus sp.]SMM99688.1 hypothetical protein SPONL_839 [uncultured Candidatus Thioglobus sp.]